LSVFIYKTRYRSNNQNLKLDNFELQEESGTFEIAMRLNACLNCRTAGREGLATLLKKIVQKKFGGLIK